MKLFDLGINLFKTNLAMMKSKRWVILHFSLAGKQKCAAVTHAALFQPCTEPAPYQFSVS